MFLDMYNIYILLTNSRVVTINISVRPLRFPDTLHKDKRLVSLLLGELVYCVVLKRSRIRGLDELGFSFASEILAAHSCTFRKEHCGNEMILHQVSIRVTSVETGYGVTPQEN
jgi:hypothetical protein